MWNEIMLKREKYAAETKDLKCYPFIASTLLVGRQEGRPACKKLGVDLLVVTIWLELCTTYSCSCHHHFRHP